METFTIEKTSETLTAREQEVAQAVLTLTDYVAEMNSDAFETVIKNDTGKLQVRFEILDFTEGKATVN